MRRTRLKVCVKMTRGKSNFNFNFSDEVRRNFIHKGVT